MNRVFRFFTSPILTIAVFLLILIFAASAQAEQDYSAISVTGVVDGDTLRAKVGCLPVPLNSVSIRIMGIDTPEKSGKCSDEREKAKVAAAFLKKKYSETKEISFKWIEWDKYGGRILADVYFDGKSVSEMMIESGLAIPYSGGAKKGWCLTHQGD